MSDFFPDTDICSYAPNAWLFKKLLGFCEFLWVLIKHITIIEALVSKEIFKVYSVLPTISSSSFGLQRLTFAKQQLMAERMH